MVWLFKVRLLSASHVPVLCRLRRNALLDPEFAHGGPTTERKAETGLASPRAKGNLDISREPPSVGEKNAAHPRLKPHRAISTSTNQPHFTGGDSIARGLGKCSHPLHRRHDLDSPGWYLGSPDAGAENGVPSWHFNHLRTSNNCWEN